MIESIVLGTLYSAAAVQSAWVLYLTLLGLSSLFKKSFPQNSQLAKRFLILIPAHNEEESIAGTLKSVEDAVRADGASALTVVIADNCSDRTADEAGRFSATVLERKHESLRGKAHALQFAVDWAQDKEWDALVVIDSDTEIQTGFFKAMNNALISGARVAQAHYGVLQTSGHWRSRLLALAWSIFNYTRPLGRSNLGLSAGILGNGFAATREIIEKHPLGRDSIVEDLDYHLELTAKDERVVFVPDAKLLSPPATDARAAAIQRTRWESGRVDALKRWAFPLIQRGPRLESLSTLFDMTVPPLAMLFASVLCVAAGFAVMLEITGLALCALCACLLIGLTVVSCFRSGAGFAPLLGAPYVPFYIVWKLGLYLTRAFWSERRWRRTPRAAAAILFAFSMNMGGCAVYNVDEMPKTVPYVPGKAISFHADKNQFPRVSVKAFEKLQAGDVVGLQLSGDQGISGSYTVAPNGQISVPFLGSYKVSGRPLDKFAEELKKRAELYYEKPILQFDVKTYSKRYAYTLGALNKPGAVELSSQDNLLTVLSKSGGLHIRENERKQSQGSPKLARIIRNNQHIAQIDLHALLSGGSIESNIAILPGDVIHIPQDNTPTITVLGQVKRPGLLGLTPGMNLLQALSLSSGLTEDADDDEVRVIRNWWYDKPQVFQVDLDDLERGIATASLKLQDGDIIYVPRSGLATFNYYLRQITPSLSTAGSAGLGLGATP